MSEVRSAEPGAAREATEDGETPPSAATVESPTQNAPAGVVDEAAEADAPSVGPVETRLVHRTVRTHNLLVFVLVAVGLVSFASARFIPGDPVSRGWRTALTVLRVVFPLTALALTGVVTNRALRRFVRRNADAALRYDALAPVFCRCKLVAMLMMVAAGLFAGVCMMFVHRVLDLVLAVLPLVLLVVTRPAVEGLPAFVRLAEGLREDQAEERGT